MKKITLFFAFIVATFYVNAQKTYDFSASANPGTWEQKGSSISATPSADGIILEFGSGTPRLDITRAADPFDVATGTHAVLTIVNNNTEAASFRFQFDKNNTGESGTQFLGWQEGTLSPAASAGNGVEQTLVFELASANYNNDGGGTGTPFANDTDGLDNMEYIAVAFRNASSSNLTGDSATNGNIVIKKIEIVNAGAVTKNDYDFAVANIAGFSATNSGAGDISDGGTTLNFNGDGTKATPKVAQTFFAADASNTHVHIVVPSNASNADQVKFQFVDAGDVTQTYGNQTLNIGSTTTIDINLTGKPEWTGSIDDWRLVFSNSGATNIDTGTIQISNIVFDNNATLSAKDYNKVDFAMYPNPAREMLYLKSSQEVSKIAVFDITGKKILETSKLVDNAISVSSLKSGLYLVQIEDVNQNMGIKKLVIE